MIEFVRSLCTDHRVSAEREWLVTNGIGGYASGTVAGILTRRYHGMLVAALKPPVGRTLLCSRLDETATYDEADYNLYANSWSAGTVFTNGFVHLDRFALEGTVPVWTYIVADAVLEKRVWMQQGANTTYVRYTLRRGHATLALKIKALVNHRGYHDVTRGGEWVMAVESAERGLRVTARPDVEPFYLLSAEASAAPQHIWYRNYYLAQEAYRGEAAVEDHLYAGQFEVTLQPGESMTLALSTQPDCNLDGAVALAEQHAHEAALLAIAPVYRQCADAPEGDAIRQLVLAADQFIVRRDQPGHADGRTIIAGYHWFTDWGRDTMISLVGLAFPTGRPAIARQILLTFAGYLDQGMLPNRFPDEGEAPEYNTVDATLWYVEAIRAYVAATADLELLRTLWPALQEIVHWHEQGTRYGIRVDGRDGLLYAGESGVQLTWMDAKVGDWVVTPRIGKPVEINALWYHALRCMGDFADQLGADSAPYHALAERAGRGFASFWNTSAGYCYDVIDGPHGLDASLRPNQLLAVALPYSPLSPAQQQAVVNVCLAKLWTPVGLRSLAPHERGYQGRYGGDRRARDGAYHQGTAWGWLMGPLAAAHLRAFGDRQAARDLLRPMLRQLTDFGVGTVGEIFDGDPPFTPRGCIAQAWTVGELLRLWWETADSDADC